MKITLKSFYPTRKLGFLPLLLFYVTSTYAIESDSLSLEDIVRLAEVENLSLKRESIGKTRSDIAVDAAKHSYLPTVTSSLNDNYTFIAGGQSVSNNTISASIGASVNLFNGFSDMNTLEKVQILQKSSLSSYTWKRESICYEASAYYFGLLKKREAVVIAENSLALEEELLNIIERKMSFGAQTKADYLRQSATVERSKQIVLSSKNQLALSLLSIKKLLNRKVNDTLFIKSINGSQLVDKIEAECNSEKSAKEIAKIRSDIESANLQLDALKKSEDIANAGFLPTLSFGINASDNYSNTDARSWGDQWAFGNTRASMSLNLSYKIFDGFATKDKVRDIKEQISIKELDYQEMINSLDYDISEANINLSAAISELSSARSQLAFAQESWKLTKASFENGMAVSYDVTQARNTLLEAQINLVEKEYVIIVKWLDKKYYSGEIIDAVLIHK